jgi:alkanesulfonate monooxygenase SsuD/methylene tetrahydromethanopterin reductase-like flavin-dependent oxidoreductase (luciferase family)
MRYSLLSAVRNHPERAYALADVYADYIGDAILAEELGFERAWFGEHHFRPDQWTGSPIQLCSAVAARTEKLRVGTAVSCVPFHDPRRLAEDVAIADLLSKGRFDFGVAPGSQYEEFQIFGVDPAEMTGRTFEAVDWIIEAFASKGEFSHRGRYYDIPEMTFTTKPVQTPLPVWYGGMGPKNVARAAQRGFDYIGPFNPGYDQALMAAGRNPSDHNIAVMQMVFVADTADEAWDLAGDGLEYFANFYNLRKDLNGKPSDRPPVTKAMLRRGTAGMWTAAVGTPDDVIAALRPWVDGSHGHVTELACAFRHAGMRNKVDHSMRLFAEHVMPALTEIARG